MWRRLVLQKFKDDSEKLSASIFMVEGNHKEGVSTQSSGWCFLALSFLILKMEEEYFSEK
jgi:hypothetical protein